MPAVVATGAAPAFATSIPCANPPTQPAQNTTVEIRQPISGTLSGGPNGYANNSTVANSGKYLGTDKTVRWWEWINNLRGTDVPGNYLTYTRSWTITVIAGRTYTISGSVQADYGNNCITCSDGAGVMVQTSSNGTTWTTQATFVTRSGMAAVGSTTGIPIRYGGVNSTVLVPSATVLVWSQSFWSSTFCNWTGFYNGGAYTTTPQTTATGTGLLYSNVTPFAFNVASTSTTLYVRYINFIQPLSNSGSCNPPITGTGAPAGRTSDDIGTSDPSILC